MTTVLFGKVEEKGNQDGRPPTPSIDKVKADGGLQQIHQSRDPDRWRHVVAKSGGINGPTQSW